MDNPLDNIDRIFGDNHQNNDNLWFSIENFEEYQKYLTTNGSISLFEEANIATRMKLRRAAKRTSKIRSRKRFIKRGIRKNKTQLKKRAYNQVKTMLRKRLTGGRPWSKLSLASRARIDKAISKRKPMFLRMIASRMPRMATQETKRLQRLRQRRLHDSYDGGLFHNLAENVRGPHPKGSLAINSDSKTNKKVNARQRQQRHRQRLKQNPIEFLKSINSAKINGKYELIKDGSVNSKHINVNPISSINDALTICKKTSSGDFKQTKTSKEVCGDLTKRSKPKGTKKMANPEKSSKQFNSIVQENLPKEEQLGNPTKLPKILQGLVVENGYSPQDLEASIVLASKMIRFGFTNLNSEIKNIQSILQKANEMTNGDIEAINDLYKQLSKEYDLTENDIVTLISKNGLYETAEFQFYDAFMRMDDKLGKIYKPITMSEPGSKNFGFGFNGSDTLEQYYLVSTNNLQVLTTSNMIIPSKSSFVAVHIPTILAFVNKEDIKPNELDKVINLHVQNVNMDMSNTNDEKTKSSTSDYLTKFLTWSETNPHPLATTLREYRTTNPTSTLGIAGYVGFSVQIGKNKIGSGPSGVGNVIFGETLNEVLSNHSQDEISKSSILTKLLESKTKILSLIDEFSNSGTPADGTNISTKSAELKQELNTSLKTLILFNEIKKDLLLRDFMRSLLKISLTGKSFIPLGSPGIAEFIFTGSYGIAPSAKTAEIDDTFLTQLISNLSENNLSKSIFSLNVKNKRPDMNNGGYHIWTIIKMIDNLNQASTPQEPIKEEFKPKFSHNPLLKSLTEQFILLEKKSKQSTDKLTRELQEYVAQSKQWVMNDPSIYSLLEFLGIDLEFSTEDIDFNTLIPKTNLYGKNNTVYIHGKEFKVPVDDLTEQSSIHSIVTSFLQGTKKLHERNYEREYKLYHGTPQHRKERSRRVLARRALEKMGRVHKGDGKDVDHKDGNPMNNSTGNLRVRDRSENRADH